MKKMLIILTLLATSLSVSFAQTLLVRNISACDVEFTAVEVDVNCNIVNYDIVTIPAGSNYNFPILPSGNHYAAADINTFMFGGTWSFEIEPPSFCPNYCPQFGYSSVVSGPANCQPTLTAEWGDCREIRIY
jgi:hypothetical protein